MVEMVLKFTFFFQTDENIHPTLEELKHFQDKTITDSDFVKERRHLSQLHVTRFIRF